METGTDAVTSEDMRELTEALNRFVAAEKRTNGSTNESGTQNNATWNINAGGTGVWIATTAALVCVLIAGFAVYIADDAKDEVRAERLSREIMNKWTAQEVTAIRSYITTGKLAPMNPPPVQEDNK